MFWIDTSGRRIENLSDTVLCGKIDDVQVDGCRIVHHIGIMLSGEDISGTAHICGKLIYLIKETVEHVLAHVLIAKIADNEFIGNSGAELGVFEIDSPYPVPLTLQSDHQVVADKPTGSANKRRFHGFENTISSWNNQLIPVYEHITL